MNLLTIKEALELRAAMKQERHTSAYTEVLGRILTGEYDRYNTSAAGIAREDVDFLRKGGELRKGGVKP